MRNYVPVVVLKPQPNHGRKSHQFRNVVTAAVQKMMPSAARAITAGIRASRA